MSDLWTTAEQLGLTAEQVDEALEVGARMIAHGFTRTEMDEMIKWQYGQWVHDATQAENRTASPMTMRRVLDREQRRETP